MFIGSSIEKWKREYFLHDVEWRGDAKCQMEDDIATLSKEVSVMISVTITGDRINTIMFQFSGRRSNLKADHEQFRRYNWLRK